MRRAFQTPRASAIVTFLSVAGLCAATHGAEPLVLEGHTDFVRVMAFSPDGKTLASGADDHTVRLWDTTTGKSKHTLIGHKTWEIWAMSYSYDGKVLATMNGLGSECFLWDVASGKQLVAFNNEKGWSPSLTFSPDGKQLASSEPPLAWITFWDPKTGQPGRQWMTDHKTEERAVGAKLRFLPGGKTLAVGDDAGFLRLWDVAAGKATRRIKAHEGAIASLDVSRDGKQIATGGILDKKVCVWNAATGEKTATFALEDGDPDWVGFSPDGKSIFSAEHTLRIWDLASKKSTHVIPKLYQCTLSPDWKLCATTDYRKTIQVRPLKDVQEKPPAAD